MNGFEKKYVSYYIIMYAQQYYHYCVTHLRPDGYKFNEYISFVFVKSAVLKTYYSFIFYHARQTTDNDRIRQQVIFVKLITCRETTDSYTWTFYFSFKTRRVRPDMFGEKNRVDNVCGIWTDKIQISGSRLISAHGSSIRVGLAVFISEKNKFIFFVLKTHNGLYYNETDDIRKRA